MVNTPGRVPTPSYAMGQKKSSRNEGFSDMFLQLVLWSYPEWHFKNTDFEQSTC